MREEEQEKRIALDSLCNWGSALLLFVTVTHLEIFRLGGAKKKEEEGRRKERRKEEDRGGREREGREKEKKD